MRNFRGLLVSLAQIMMVVVIAIATLGGFISGYVSSGIVLALFGGVAGFVAGAIAMSFIAILLDIRESLATMEVRLQK